MRVITGNIYRMRAAIGDVVKPWLTIEAADMNGADAAVLAHFADEADGLPIRIVAASEILFDETGTAVAAV
jgi:hypothetical protein